MFNSPLKKQGKHRKLRSDFKNLIKENINKFGFDKVGFSKIDKVDEEIALIYKDAVGSFLYKNLPYLQRNLEVRLNPKLLFPEGKTIISLATGYYKKLPENCFFSKYLTKVDYHRVLKKRMKEFVLFLKKEIGNFNYKFFVDTAPVLEKYWAYKSGIGWIGKNSLLITKEFGSFVFLSEIIVDFEIEPDVPCENLCGDCVECIKNCPAGAIESENRIDVKKCISYLTVEKRDKLTGEEKQLLKKGKYISGCDTCQDVCPWNKKIPEKSDDEITIPDEFIEKNIEFYLRMSKNEYNEYFGRTVLSRVPYDVFIDNLKVFLKKV